MLILNTICRISFAACSRLSSLAFTDSFRLLMVSISSFSSAGPIIKLSLTAFLNPPTCCCRYRRNLARVNEFCARAWIIFLLRPCFSSFFCRCLQQSVLFQVQEMEYDNLRYSQCPYLHQSGHSPTFGARALETVYKTLSSLQEKYWLGS